MDLTADIAYISPLHLKIETIRYEVPFNDTTNSHVRITNRINIISSVTNYIQER